MISRLNNDDVKELINRYQRDIKPFHRYASFDYCYNYFQSFQKDGNIADIASEQNIEKSVLQLGFYLASWGMYRGSSALLRHSSHCLIPIIKFISKTQPEYWTIDIHNYGEKLPQLEKLYEGIEEKIKFPISKKENQKVQGPTVTLVTKIMLGVFGNTPAFDNYFLNGIGKINYHNYNIKNFKEICKELADVYNFHKEDINSHEIKTLSFNDGNSVFAYPKAKLIDMIFFERGKEMQRIENEKKLHPII